MPIQPRTSGSGSNERLDFHKDGRSIDTAGSKGNLAKKGIRLHNAFTQLFFKVHKVKIDGKTYYLNKKSFDQYVARTTTLDKGAEEAATPQDSIQEVTEAVDQAFNRTIARHSNPNQKGSRSTARGDFLLRHATVYSHHDRIELDHLNVAPRDSNVAHWEEVFDLEMRLHTYPAMTPESTTLAVKKLEVKAFAVELYGLEVAETDFIDNLPEHVVNDLYLKSSYIKKLKNLAFEEKEVQRAEVGIRDQISSIRDLKLQLEVFVASIPGGDAVFPESHTFLTTDQAISQIPTDKLADLAKIYKRLELAIRPENREAIPANTRAIPIPEDPQKRLGVLLEEYHALKKTTEYPGPDASEFVTRTISERLDRKLALLQEKIAHFEEANEHVNYLWELQDRAKAILAEIEINKGNATQLSQLQMELNKLVDQFNERAEHSSSKTISKARESYVPLSKKMVERAPQDIVADFQKAFTEAEAERQRRFKSEIQPLKEEQRRLHSEAERIRRDGERIEAAFVGIRNQYRDQCDPLHRIEVLDNEIRRLEDELQTAGGEGQRAAINARRAELASSDPHNPLRITIPTERDAGNVSLDHIQRLQELNTQYISFLRARAAGSERRLPTSLSIDRAFPGIDIGRTEPDFLEEVTKHPLIFDGAKKLFQLSTDQCLSTTKHNSENDIVAHDHYLGNAPVRYEFDPSLLRRMPSGESIDSRPPSPSSDDGFAGISLRAQSASAHQELHRPPTLQELQREIASEFAGLYPNTEQGQALRASDEFLINQIGKESDSYPLLKHLNFQALTRFAARENLNILASQVRDGRMSTTAAIMTIIASGIRDNPLAETIAQQLKYDRSEGQRIDRLESDPSVLNVFDPNSTEYKERFLPIMLLDFFSPVAGEGFTTQLAGISPALSAVVNFDNLSDFMNSRRGQALREDLEAGVLTIEQALPLIILKSVDSNLANPKEEVLRIFTEDTTLHPAFKTHEALICLVDTDFESSHNFVKLLFSCLPADFKATLRPKIWELSQDPDFKNLLDIGNLRSFTTDPAIQSLKMDLIDGRISPLEMLAIVFNATKFPNTSAEIKDVLITKEFTEDDLMHISDIPQTNIASTRIYLNLFQDVLPPQVFHEAKPELLKLCNSEEFKELVTIQGMRDFLITEDGATFLEAVRLGSLNADELIIILSMQGTYAGELKDRGSEEIDRLLDILNEAGLQINAEARTNFKVEHYHFFSKIKFLNCFFSILPGESLSKFKNLRNFLFDLINHPTFKEIVEYNIEDIEEQSQEDIESIGIVLDRLSEIVTDEGERLIAEVSEKRKSPLDVIAWTLFQGYQDTKISTPRNIGKYKVMFGDLADKHHLDFTGRTADILEGKHRI